MNTILIVLAVFMLQGMTPTEQVPEGDDTVVVHGAGPGERMICKLLLSDSRAAYIWLEDLVPEWLTPDGVVNYECRPVPDFQSSSAEPLPSAAGSEAATLLANIWV